MTNTIFQSLLIMFIIGGIYFELQTPRNRLSALLLHSKIGALFCTTLHYLFAANWEIIIFFIGVILLILEIFVIPGFGIAGISGIVPLFLIGYEPY